MFNLGKSTTSQHILDLKTEKALCGFPGKFRSTVQVEDLAIAETTELRICKTCRSIAETGNRAEPMHLRHKKSQLTELKDQLLTREISYDTFRKKAYPLQKEIQALEASKL